MVKVRPLAWVSVGFAAAAAIGVVLLFTWYLPLFRDAVLPGSGQTRTTSLELVGITLRDAEPRAELQLMIPQAYLVRGQDRRGGALESLKIETRLPDLTPAPFRPEIVGSSGSLERTKSETVFNNSLSLWVGTEFVEPHWETGTTRENWLARFSADANSGRAVAFELVNEDYSGLWFYRELSCGSSEDASGDTAPARARQCRDTYREHYLSRDAQRPTVKIDCDVAHLAILTYRLGCTAHTTYRGFRLSYVFRYSQLNRWSEFDSGIRQLLDGFVTNSSPQ